MVTSALNHFSTESDFVEYQVVQYMGHQACVCALLFWNDTLISGDQDGRVIS